MNDKYRGMLEAILDGAVDAIITIDANGMIEVANPAAERLFGYSLDEMVGQNVKMLMPSPYREQHDGYLNKYHQTREAKIIGIGREVVGQRKDGTTFPMHLAVSEVATSDRKMFTGIVRDISDLKEAENSLRELNEELEQRVQQRTSELRDAQDELVRKEKLATLGQVSGGIAHEIRNPLNAVKTSAYYLLHARNPSDQKRKEHLERIDRQVTLIDNVVTALTDVAKMPTPNRVETDLKVLVQDAVGVVALPDAIELEVLEPEKQVQVQVDANQIPIVVRNLIRNARDAMPEGGKLTISVNDSDASSSFSVSDTGTGIPDDILAKLTEPMFTTKARGMGLGLAISKAIIGRNGGQLKIESQVGQGSTFTVLFPKT
ncbi:MAG: two-component system sensor histidine kinase NtrB [Aureliella sp.]